MINTQDSRIESLRAQIEAQQVAELQKQVDKETKRAEQTEALRSQVETRAQEEAVSALKNRGKSSAVVTSDDAESELDKTKDSLSTTVDTASESQVQNNTSSNQAQSFNASSFEDESISALQGDILRSNLQEISSIQGQISSIQDLLTRGFDDAPSVKKLESALQERINETEAQNARVQQSTRTSLMNSVGFRAQSQGAQSILDDTERKGQEEIEDLTTLYEEKILEAKNALRENNVDEINRLQGEIKTIKSDISSSLATQATNVRLNTTAAINANKSALQAQEIYNRMNADTLQISRDAMVIGLINQGITDPAVLFDYANFDNEGNQVGDISLNEIGDVLSAVQETKDKPNTQIVGSDASGRYLVTYSDEGKILSKTLVTGARAVSTGGSNNARMLTGAELTLLQKPKYQGGYGVSLPFGATVSDAIQATGGGFSQGVSRSTSNGTSVQQGVTSSSQVIKNFVLNLSEEELNIASGRIGSNGNQQEKQRDVAFAIANKVNYSDADITGIEVETIRNNNFEDL